MLYHVTLIDTINLARKQQRTDAVIPWDQSH